MAKEDVERARAYLPGLDKNFKTRAGLKVVGGRVHLPWGEDFWIRRDLYDHRGPKMLYPEGAHMPAYYEPPLTDAGRENTDLFIVESPFCSLYAAAADFNVVAMGGLRVQDGLVKHATGFERVVLAFDSDESGQNFIPKAAEQLAPHVKELYRCQLPRGRKDIRDIAVFATDMGLDWQDEVTLALTGDISKIEITNAEANLLEEARSIFKLVDITEFEQPPPPQRFIVDPWLGREEVCSFTSMWKTGKSWLLLDLCLSVAGAKDTWLDMPVTHGPILYVDEENGHRELWRRIELMTGGSIGPVKENFHLVTHSGLKLDDEDYYLPRLFAFVEDLRPVLIVFDATARFHQLDENSSREMAYLHDISFKPLAKTRFDCAVVAADHPTKSLMGTPRDFLQAVRGSGDKIAQVERLWYLVKAGTDDDVVTLHHPGIRTGAIPPPITIRRKFEEGGMYHEILGHGERAARAIATEGDLNVIVEYIRSTPTHSARREALIDITSEDRAVRALTLGIESGTLTKMKDPDDRRKTIYRVASPVRLTEDTE